MSKVTRPSKHGPVKKRDREASARRILEAGLQVFSEFGYDGATTKMVAQRAGLNESLLHRYYQSKSGLLVAIILSFAESERETRPYPAGADLEEEVFNFLSHRFEHAREKQAFLRVVVSRAIVDPSFRNEFRKRITPASSQLLLERLKEMKKRGQLRKDVDPQNLVETITAQGFAVGFIGGIVLGRSREDSLKHLALFAKHLALGVQA